MTRRQNKRKAKQPKDQSKVNTGTQENESIIIDELYKTKLEKQDLQEKKTEKKEYKAISIVNDLQEATLENEILYFFMCWEEFVLGKVINTLLFPRKNQNESQLQHIVAQCQKRAFEDVFITDNNNEHNLHFYAVCDGHGNAHRVDEFHTVSILKEHLANKVFQHYLKDEKKTPEDSIINAFLEMDRLIAEKSAHSIGSTCAAIMIDLNTEILFTIQLGDSLLWLKMKDGTICNIRGQHPNQPDEETRIKEAGFFVFTDRTNGISRINGHIAVSRSFGDFDYKKIIKSNSDGTGVPTIDFPNAERTGAMIAIPKVQQFDLKKISECWLATDGLTECQPNMDLDKMSTLTPSEVLFTSASSTDDTTVMKVNILSSNHF